MTTVDDWLRNAKYVRDNILDETERIVYSKEDQIIKLQTSQMEASLGSDGKELKNVLPSPSGGPLYSGRYKLKTQLFSEYKNYLAPKIAGDRYNFLATGDFFRGMDIKMSNDLTKFELFSTGTGSERKALFFFGYTNLFGLTNNNTEIVNYKIILPELQKFVKKYL